MTAVNPGMAIEKTSVASASRSNRRSTGKIGHGSTKNAENLSQSDIIPMEAQEGANPTQEVEAKYTKVKSPQSVYLHPLDEIMLYFSIVIY